MLCPLSRMQMSSALDHGGALPWPASRHAERCDGCRAHQARLGALHVELAVGAARAPSPPPSRAPSRARLPIAAGLVAAAAALVLFVALRRGSEQPAAAPSPAPRASEVATVTPPPPPTLGAADILVDQAGDLMTAPPLRAELTALLDDGRRGALAVLDQAGLGGEE